MNYVGFATSHVVGVIRVYVKTFCVPLRVLIEYNVTHMIVYNYVYT